MPHHQPCSQPGGTGAGRPEASLKSRRGAGSGSGKATEKGWGGAVGAQQAGKAGPRVARGGTQASQEGVLEKLRTTTPGGDAAGTEEEEKEEEAGREAEGGPGAHLQVGELLLLVGDGLLHQHALDALLHGVLLGLRETVVRSTGGPAWANGRLPPLAPRPRAPGGTLSPSGGPPAAQASGEAAPALRLCSARSPS